MTKDTSVAPLSPAQIAGLDDPHLLTQCQLGVRQADGTFFVGLGMAGMYCAACSITIEDALMKIDGVRQVQVQSATQRARILLDPGKVTLSQLVLAVQAVGYKAWPDAAARAGHERLLESRKLLWRLVVAAFCMMQVMMITTAQYVSGPHEIPPDIWNLMNWACWVLSLPVVLFSCGPFISGALKAASRGAIAMDTPVAIGIVAMFVVSMGVTFGAQETFGHDAYYDSLTMFVTFLLTGRWLESRAREKVTQSLESLFTRLPEAVDRAVAPVNPESLIAATTETVPISSLVHGDHVKVAVGQAFPADGLIVHGSTQVDEAMLTGESRAVARQLGQVVVAGSLNLGAPVWMKVERLGPDTRYQKIVSLVHQALTEKPGWMSSADRFAGYFLWTVLALAAIGWLAWQWIDPSRSVWVAVSVLVVTCPCALSLAAPSALLAAAGAMAKHGILVRRLGAMEDLAKVHEVYFDKTGTLTEGELTLQGAVFLVEPTVIPVESLNHQDIFQQAASLASLSQHPLSKSLSLAVQNLPDQDGFQLPVPASTWREVKEEAGRGLQALDAQGISWRLGSAAWVFDQTVGVNFTDHPTLALARVWFAPRTIDISLTHAVGFVFDEALRPDAPASIQALLALGVKSHILSGDQEDRVQLAIKHLGGSDRIGLAMTQASPEDKLALISRAQQQGQKVVVVGDGINDAPVLAKADVSVALDQGAALAQSQADLLVLGGRLTGLPKAISISRSAVEVIRQNLIWAASYNLICIPLALSGRLPPWLAGLGMALSSFFVVLNAIRLTALRP